MRIRNVVGSGGFGTGLTSRLGGWVLTLTVAAVAAGSALGEDKLTDVTAWRGAADRHWIGADFWANRLQDWAVRDGVLTCAASYGGWNWRTAHLLTHDLAAVGQDFAIELDLDRGEQGRAGLLLAGGEGRISHRKASLIQGLPGTNGGYLVAWDFSAGGQEHALRILDFGTQENDLVLDLVRGHTVVKALGGAGPQRATLSVRGERAGAEVRVVARLTADGAVLAETTGMLQASRMVGNVAMVSEGSAPDAPHRFHRLRLGGERVAAHPDRAFGPIAGVLFGVANGDLKVGVQCVSLGATMRPTSASKEGGNARLAVRLERKEADGSWTPVSHPTAVAEPDYYALIRVRGHDVTRPHNLRVVTNGAGDLAAAYGFHVPAEPEGEVVVGAVSCSGTAGRRSNQPEITADGGRLSGRWSDANLWAPHEGVTGPLLERKPDLVFFTGDQLYEYNPTPRHPTDAFPHADYLYKWLMWHWSFNELTRRVPTVIQTDDHDVWHPNLWGEGGRLMTDGWDRGGGYLMSSYFVNLVQRTMTGHNPDAHDPGPLDSGVTNYYTTFTYGGVDFAVLEDRKFKSASVEASRQTDGLQLLGDAQLNMLKQWAEAPDRAPARVVVSQTNYATVFTHLKTGKIGASRDTDGWPKAPRDAAVAVFEQAGALLFTGDQHLSSVTRLRTDTGPGVVQFCQPAAACIWWRSFFPDANDRTGPLLAPGAPDHHGRFADGTGNLFDVLALANPGDLASVRRHPNPQRYRLTPAEVAQGVGDTRRIHRGEGFAVLHIQPEADRMRLECWPLGADVKAGPAGMFPDWPVDLELSTLQTVGSPDDR